MAPSNTATHVASSTRRILAIDGGGIRGVIALEILIALEDHLRERLGKDDKFVLSDYFDFIAGTSTGGIVAASLAMGYSARSIRTFYQEQGKKIFTRAPWWRLFYSFYTKTHLTAALRDIFGEHTTLGSDRLKTLLMLTMRNASTDSPWFLTNAPGAKYNQKGIDGCNLEIPLWQLVRASTAAPAYFPPEEVKVGNQIFVFEDGGMTTFNNPAFQAYLMATLPEYGVGWEGGEDRLHLVSVGTGQCDIDGSMLQGRSVSVLKQAVTIPMALLNAAGTQQDALCRVVGSCKFGAPIDSEVGDLTRKGQHGIPPQFAYWRFNPDLCAKCLKTLGLGHLNPAQVQALDGVDMVPAMQEVGAAYAKTCANQFFAI